MISLLKIYKRVLIVGVLVVTTFLYSQEATIDLTILPSGQYTLSDWNNSNLNLWTATVIGDLSKNYFIEMKFYISGSSEPDIWGISEKYSLPLNNNNFSYENMLDLCDGRCYSQSDDFINSIKNTMLLSLQRLEGIQLSHKCSFIVNSSIECCKTMKFSINGKQQLNYLQNADIKSSDIVIFYDGVNDVYYTIFSGYKEGWRPGAGSTTFRPIEKLSKFHKMVFILRKKFGKKRCEFRKK